MACLCGVLLRNECRPNSRFPCAHEQRQHTRAIGDEASSRAISISIREKLPLMNGLGGCEAEVQLTPEQATLFAQTLLELVSRIAPVASQSEIQNLTTVA
jgi:hypothetical protein